MWTYVDLCGIHRHTEPPKGGGGWSEDVYLIWEMAGAGVKNDMMCIEYGSRVFG